MFEFSPKPSKVKNFCGVHLSARVHLRDNPLQSSVPFLARFFHSWKEIVCHLGPKQNGNHGRVSRWCLLRFWIKKYAARWAYPQILSFSFSLFIFIENAERQKERLNFRSIFFLQNLIPRKVKYRSF